MEIVFSTVWPNYGEFVPNQLDLLGSFHRYDPKRYRILSVRCWIRCLPRVESVNDSREGVEASSGTCGIGGLVPRLIIGVKGFV